MPTYIYHCHNGHESVITHSIAECDISRFCPQCGGQMHRSPQLPRVNWNGLPPHLEHTRPKAVQDFIDSAPRRRDEYHRLKEEYNAQKKK